MWFYVNSGFSVMVACQLPALCVMGPGERGAYSLTPLMCQARKKQRHLNKSTKSRQYMWLASSILPPNYWKVFGANESPRKSRAR